MGRLSNLGQRVLSRSALRLTSAVNAVTDDLKGGLRELLAPSDADRSEGAPDPAPPVKPDLPKLGDPDKPAQIFGTQSCPWTGRALALLEREGAPFEFVDLDAAENATLCAWLVADTKQNTNPYIFLRGRFIGGFNALDEITRLGQLKHEMLTAAERAQQTSRVRIEIATRDDSNRPPPGES